MKALTALVLYSVWELQANNSLFTKSLMAYSFHVMQSIGMGLCMHIHLYMTFIRAKFQMSPWSNKRTVAV